MTEGIDCKLLQHRLNVLNNDIELLETDTDYLQGPQWLAARTSLARLYDQTIRMQAQLHEIKIIEHQQNRGKKDMPQTTRSELTKTVNVNFTALILTAHKLGMTKDTLTRLDQYRDYMLREIQNSTLREG